jgi:RND superfamily putative drug exporter
MTLLGDRAWWLPAWLDRVLPRIALDGDAEPVDSEPGGEGHERRRQPLPARPAPAEGEG